MIKITAKTNKTELLQMLAKEIPAPEENLFIEIISIPFYLNTEVAFKIFAYQVSNYPKPIYWYSHNKVLLDFLKRAEANIPKKFLLDETPLLPRQESQIVSFGPTQIPNSVGFARSSDNFQDGDFVNWDVYKNQNNHQNSNQSQKFSPNRFQQRSEQHSRFGKSAGRSQILDDDQSFDSGLNSNSVNSSGVIGGTINDTFDQASFGQINNNSAEWQKSGLGGKRNPKTQIHFPSSQELVSGFANRAAENPNLDQENDLNYSSHSPYSNNYPDRSRSRNSSNFYQDAGQQNYNSDSRKPRFEDAEEEAQNINLQPQTLNNQNLYNQTNKGFKQNGFGSVVDFKNKQDWVNYNHISSKNILDDIGYQKSSLIDENEEQVYEDSGYDSKIYQSGYKNKKSKSYFEARPNKITRKAKNKGFLSKLVPSGIFSGGKKTSFVENPNRIKASQEELEIDLKTAQKELERNYLGDYLKQKKQTKFWLFNQQLVVTASFSIIFFITGISLLLSFFPTQVYTFELSPLSQEARINLDLNIRQFEVITKDVSVESSITTTGKQASDGLSKVRISNRSASSLYITNGGFLLEKDGQTWETVVNQSLPNTIVIEPLERNPIEVEVKNIPNQNLKDGDVLTIRNLNGDRVCGNCEAKVLGGKSVGVVTESDRNTLRANNDKALDKKVKEELQAIRAELQRKPISDLDSLNVQSSQGLSINSSISLASSPNSSESGSNSSPNQSQSSSESARDNSIEKIILDDWYKHENTEYIYDKEVGTKSENISLKTKTTTNFYYIDKSQLETLIKDKRPDIFSIKSIKIENNPNNFQGTVENNIVLSLTCEFTKYDDIDTIKLSKLLSEKELSEEVKKDLQNQYPTLKKINKKSEGFMIPGLSPRVNIDVVKN